MSDDRTTEKLIEEFVAVACECEVRDYLISEYAERIEQAIAVALGNEREKKLEALVQKALDECWCDEWWYEDARKLGMEANY